MLIMRLCVERGRARMSRGGGVQIGKGIMLAGLLAVWWLGSNFVCGENPAKSDEHGGVVQEIFACHASKSGAGFIGSQSMFHAEYAGRQLKLCGGEGYIYVNQTLKLDESASISYFIKLREIKYGEVNTPKREMEQIIGFGVYEYIGFNTYIAFLKLDVVNQLASAANIELVYPLLPEAKVDSQAFVPHPLSRLIHLNVYFVNGRFNSKGMVQTFVDQFPNNYAENVVQISLKYIQAWIKEDAYEDFIYYVSKDPGVIFIESLKPGNFVFHDTLQKKKEIYKGKKYSEKWDEELFCGTGDMCTKTIFEYDLEQVQIKIPHSKNTIAVLGPGVYRPKCYDPLNSLEVCRTCGPTKWCDLAAGNGVCLKESADDEENENVVILNVECDPNPWSDCPDLTLRFLQEGALSRYWPFADTLTSSGPSRNHLALLIGSPLNRSMPIDLSAPSEPSSDGRPTPTATGSGYVDVGAISKIAEVGMEMKLEGDFLNPTKTFAASNFEPTPTLSSTSPPSDDEELPMRNLTFEVFPGFYLNSSIIYIDLGLNDSDVATVPPDVELLFEFAKRFNSKISTSLYDNPGERYNWLAYEHDAYIFTHPEQLIIFPSNQYRDDIKGPQHSLCKNCLVVGGSKKLLSKLTLYDIESIGHSNFRKNLDRILDLGEAECNSVAKMFGLDGCVFLRAFIENDIAEDMEHLLCCGLKETGGEKKDFSKWEQYFNINYSPCCISALKSALGENWEYLFEEDRTEKRQGDVNAPNLRKPDLQAPGFGYISSMRNKECDSGETTLTSGAAMASAYVAGLASTVTDFFEGGWYFCGFERTVCKWSNVHPSSMLSSTLLKAFLIHGSSLCGGTFDCLDESNVSGRSHGDVLIAPLLRKNGDPLGLFADTSVVSPGSSYSSSFSISPDDLASSKYGIVITLVWHDPPELAGSQSTLVNDLDLLLLSPDGAIVTGNSHLGGERDSSNNVEKIIIPKRSILIGDYQVQVVTAVLRAGATQQFSLVYSHPSIAFEPTAECCVDVTTTVTRTITRSCDSDGKYRGDIGAWKNEFSRWKSQHCTRHRP